MGAGTLVGGGGRAGRTGEPGSSGEHIPETAATEGSPAGCEAGRWAQVIPSLVFHHIHWMGRGERMKMNGHKPHALQGQHLPDQGRATYSSSKPLSRLCAAFPLMQSWVNGGRVAQLLSLLLLRTFIPAGGQALGNLTSGLTKAAS